MPGELLPLWLRHSADKRAIETTLKSRHRLFAVVRLPQSSQYSLVAYSMHTLCMQTWCIAWIEGNHPVALRKNMLVCAHHHQGRFSALELEQDAKISQHLQARYALRFH